MYASLSDTGYTRKVYFAHLILVIRVDEAAGVAHYSHQTHDDPDLESDFDFFPEQDPTLLQDVCYATLRDFRDNRSVSVHFGDDVRGYVRAQCSSVLKEVE